MPAIQTEGGKVSIKSKYIDGSLRFRNISYEESEVYLEAEEVISYIPHSINNKKAVIKCKTFKSHTNSQEGADINIGVERDINENQNSLPPGSTTYVTLETDRVGKLGVHGGNVDLNINTVRDLVLDRCKVRGYINYIGERNKDSSYNFTSFYIGKGSVWERTVDENIDINLTFNEVWGAIEVRDRIEGKILLKGNRIRGIRHDSKTEVYLDVQKIEATTQGPQVYYSVGLESYNTMNAKGAVTVSNAYIKNRYDSGPPIYISNAGYKKLTLNNCIICNKSTYAEGVNAIKASAANSNVYVLGTVVSNSPLDNNINIKWGTFIQDTSLCVD